MVGAWGEYDLWQMQEAVGDVLLFTTYITNHTTLDSTAWLRGTENL